jgi:hypothetical protein
MKALHMKLPTALRTTVGIIALIALAPLPAASQQKVSLAELAQKEAERRKGVKQTQKVITSKDLPESARKPAAAAEGEHASGAHASGAHAGSAPAAAPQGAHAAAASGDQKDEKYWRTRMAGARESLRRSEVFAEALQTRINALSLDLGNRDDRLQRARVGEDLNKAQEELTRVKNDIELAKKSIGDVEEDARKAGVPPGWLR